MADRSQITVIIPTFNEEENLPACLDSVDWADEVFVVDSFSTDATPSIAAERGARLVRHEYVNSATQKNWAIPQATHDWVMIVDADERVTPELREEVLAVLASSDPKDGYVIPRQNYFMGRRIRYSGWQNDSCLRLFRRDRGRYQDRHVHADVEIDGTTGRLKGKLLHYTFRDFEQYMEKFDRYTGLAARDRAKRTPKVRWHHLALRPAARFARQYVFRGGFLDGRQGLIISSLAAYSVFMKYAKLLEIHEAEKKRRDER